MNISIILAHPTEGSFNHAIAQAAADRIKANGHTATIHDLYKEKFDPMLDSGEITSGSELPDDIAKRCREIADADGIIIVHPNWWGQPPAILKGWTDRVLRTGVAYEFKVVDGQGVLNGLLKARAAIVFNTSNTGDAVERDDFGDTLEMIWKKCVFGFCGLTNVHRRNFSVVIASSEQQRKAWLDEVAKTVDTYFPAGK